MIRKLAFWLVCVLVFKPAGAASQASVEPWQPLAEGITYREFYLPEPNHIYVARLDQSNPRAWIETSLANGALNRGSEALLDQTARYDEALGYWDGSWGARYQVIAAINGGFFDPQSGAVHNGVVQGGWYAKPFDNRQSIGGFAWRYDRQAVIFECLIQRPGRQLLRLLPGDETVILDGLNLLPDQEQLIVYTPQFGLLTPPVKGSLVILVETGRPLTPVANPDGVRGIVRSLAAGEEGVAIPFDHIAILAQGDLAQRLRSKVTVGSELAVSFDIRHLERGCRQDRQESLAGMASALAGGDIFLRAGEVQPLAELGAVLRNPRTALALNDRYVFFIVVDGRDQLRSLGMSMVELALFAKLTLGATWGMAFDGGGSSTMLINGQVVNHPNAETVVRARADNQPRAVANGLMMVILQQAQRSHLFQPGAAVAIGANSETNLRLGPGTNFPVLAVIAPDSLGVVQDHPLNGILAKDSFWWQVAFGNRVGWVSETLLRTAD